jgi:hypothetical protein
MGPARDPPQVSRPIALRTRPDRHPDNEAVAGLRGLSTRCRSVALYRAINSSDQGTDSYSRPCQRPGQNRLTARSCRFSHTDSADDEDWDVS